MIGTHTRWSIATVLFLLLPCAAAAAEQVRMEEDFEGNLSRWQLAGEHSITVRATADPEHGPAGNWRASTRSQCAPPPTRSMVGCCS
jgi:hypothetical protein